MATTTLASTTTYHPVALALQAGVDELSRTFLERRRIIQAAVLALLSKEHMFIVGPPGTAKSALIRSICGLFDGAEYFEAILSKTRPAESVLGPYDIPALRDHGHLHRKFNGFLPTANLSMLDEMGKMSPTLGHDLLAVVLERVLHQVNGGRSYIDVPLYTVFGGSNELPTNESDDAAALWDRMLVREVVDYLQESSNFAAMLTGKVQPPTTVIPWADMAHVIDDVVPDIRIPSDVVETVLQLREALLQEDIVVSDRRWKASMKLLQSSAFMNGRSEASVDDIQVLRHSLWDMPNQISKVERLSLSVSNPIAEKALGLLEKAEEIAGEIRDSKGLAADKTAAKATELSGRLKNISEDLGKVRQEALASGASVTKLDEVSDRLNAIKRSVYSDLMNFDLTTL